MDVIRIDALELACIVGVRPRERRRKQTVRLDMVLGLDLSRAGRSGRIAHTCDYSRVIDEVSALLQFREYQLIEVATEELAAMIFGVHENVREVTLQLEKPAALGGRARAASVRITRQRTDLPAQPGAPGSASRALLLETHEAALYLYRVAPGAELVIDESLCPRRLEWLVAGDLQSGARALVESDLPIVRTGREVLTNPSSRPATLFVCAAHASADAEPDTRTEA
jgi:dihydroneopterin aldolase